MCSNNKSYGKGSVKIACGEFDLIIVFVLRRKRTISIHILTLEEEAVMIVGVNCFDLRVIPFVSHQLFNVRRGDWSTVLNSLLPVME